MSGYFPIFGPQLVEDLGWALLHATWEVALLAAGLALVLRLLRNAAPRRRYLACCIAMALMLLVPVITCCYLLSLKEYVAPTSYAAAGQSAAAAHVLPSTGVLDALSQRIDADRLERIISRTQHSLPWAAWIWFGLAGLYGAFQLFLWLALKRIVRSRTVVIESVRFERALNAFPSRRRPTLLGCELVTSPATMGWAPPIILLPSIVLNKLPPEQVNALIAHEMAHICRRDYLVNLLQLAIESLLVFHPAAWWTSKQVRAAREECCDEVAARVIGDRHTYARALLAIEELRAPMPDALLGASGSDLPSRINRLLGKAINNAAAHRRGLLSASASILFLLLIGAPLLASSVALQQERSWYTSISLAQDVYSLFPEMHGDEQGFLDAQLTACSAVRGTVLPDATILDRLVETTLIASRPDSVSRFALGRVPLYRRPQQHSALEWQNGTNRDQDRLITFLWSDAKNALAIGERNRAHRYAQAAMLLSAQLSFWFGDTDLRVRLRDESAGELIGLPAASLSRLYRRLAFEYNHKSALMNPHFAAADIIDDLFTHPIESAADPRPQKAAEIILGIPYLAHPEPRDRYMQIELLRDFPTGTLPKGTVAKLRLAVGQDADCQRWLDELASPPRDFKPRSPVIRDFHPRPASRPSQKPN